MFIFGGAAFGGPIGYFPTGFVWAGKGRPKCVRRGQLYFILWVLFLSLLVVLPIETLKPAVAHKLPCVEPVREWMISFMATTNFLIAFGCFLASFYFVGAITLCSDVGHPLRRLVKAKIANPRLSR